MKLKLPFFKRGDAPTVDIGEAASLSIGRLFALGGGVALTLLSATGAGLYWIAADNVRTETRNALRVVATGAAQDLGRGLSQTSGVLEGLAQDPALAALIAAGDAAGIHAAEERLTKIVPNALLVRLLPDSLDVPDESRVPRMGFADLDLMRQAQTTAPPPALHVANTPDAHIAIARHLGQGQGVLLASLAPKLLAAHLPTGFGPGALELKQGNLSLGFQGDAELKGASPDGTVPVPSTPWTLSYTGPGSANLDILWFLGITGLAAALLGGVGYLGYRWLTHALRHDQDNIALVARDLLSGKHSRQYAIQLKDMQRLVMQLEQLQSLGLVPAAPAPTDLPPVPELNTPGVAMIGGPPALMVEELPTPPDAAVSVAVSPTLFRAYDIRGIVGETLTPEVVKLLGRAIGSEARDRGEYTVAIAHDGRQFAAELCQALGQGLLASGCSVIDLGLVPTPVLYFATHVLNTESGVIVTGSHHAANHSGLKLVIAGEPLATKDLQRLRERIEGQEFASGLGQWESRDIVPDYLERIVHDTQLGRDMKVVVDCANGAASEIAPKLLEEIGCEVIPLYCEVDGRFPHHAPDPSRPENLKALIQAVREHKADLGIAFDGDGDRLGLVDSSGKIIWPDRQLMVFAADVLSREPGSDIIFDVKCTRHLAGHIVRHGGRPLMWKTGHAPLKAKLKETGALLAGEMNGHIIFKERWYGFDDGLYAAARMVEILSSEFRSSAEVFGELPDSVSTPELYIPLAEGENQSFIEKLRAIAEFPEARLTAIDGLRVDFADGWGLVRASNTIPALALRFEADTPEALARIQSQFKTLMQQVKPTISLPLSLADQD